MHWYEKQTQEDRALLLALYHLDHPPAAPEPSVVDKLRQSVVGGQFRGLR